MALPSICAAITGSRVITPSAKLWTLSALDGRGRPIDAPAGARSGIYSGAILRFPDGTFRIEISRSTETRQLAWRNRKRRVPAGVASLRHATDQQVRSIRTRHAHHSPRRMLVMIWRDHFSFDLRDRGCRNRPHRDHSLGSGIRCQRCICAGFALDKAVRFQADFAKRGSCSPRPIHFFPMVYAASISAKAACT